MRDSLRPRQLSRDRNLELVILLNNIISIHGVDMLHSKSVKCYKPFEAKKRTLFLRACLLLNLQGIDGIWRISTKFGPKIAQTCWKKIRVKVFRFSQKTTRNGLRRTHIYR